MVPSKYSLLLNDVCYGCDIRQAFNAPTFESFSNGTGCQRKSSTINFYEIQVQVLTNCHSNACQTMGCSSSVSHRPVAMSLTAAQKYLLRESWETVEQNKMVVGKKTFMRFFEVNPEYQKLFPEFKTLPTEELEQTKALYGHAKRVMKAVENAVSALDDVVAFSAYLQELGRRHKTRSLKPVYLDCMRDALMYALEGLLGPMWTGDTSLAWEELFQFISSNMVTGLQS